jgi:hypothetical protein
MSEITRRIIRLERALLRPNPGDLIELVIQVLDRRQLTDAELIEFITYCESDPDTTNPGKWKPLLDEIDFITGGL